MRTALVEVSLNLTENEREKKNSWFVFSKLKRPRPFVRELKKTFSLIYTRDWKFESTIQEYHHMDWNEAKKKN